MIEIGGLVVGLVAELVVVVEVLKMRELILVVGLLAVELVEIVIGVLKMRELILLLVFLLEEWACRWEPIITETFGPNRQVAREIIQADRSFLLAVKTPCSGNFETEAEAAGRLVGLPLRWAEAELDNLEEVLSAAIERKARELA